MTPVSSPPDQAEALRAMYPERDGKPMSDNMTQARWIHLLYVNLRALFANHDDVLVASDNLWYPLERRPDQRQAPDIYVVFDRPKDDRGSYMQWLENDIPLTVVFEILSPGNTQEEMIAKFLFYEHYGVEEYYVYDPLKNTLEVYERGLSALRRIRPVDGYVSKRLGIRFQMTTPEMTVLGPDGKPFLTPEQSQALSETQKEQAEAARQQAKAAAQQAEAARKQAEAARQQAAIADQRAEAATQRAEAATLLAARLIELGRKARRGQASVEELAELDRLEEECARRS